MGRLFKRGAVFYTWVPRLQGGTRKVTTNCTDEKAAHARAAELERDALDPDRAAAKAATLRDALERLIRERAGEAKAGKKSPETVKFYSKKAGVVLDGLAEVLRRSPKAHVYLHEVSAALVDDYIAQRRDDGAKDNSISKELTTWRAAMRIAKRRRLWPKDIDEVFPVGFSPSYKARSRWVSPEEFLALHAAMVRPIPVRKPNMAPEQISELRARRANGERREALAREFKVSIATVTRLTTRDEEPEPGPEQGHALFAIVCFSIATSAEWCAIWRARREDIAPDLTQVRVRGSKNENRDRPLPLTLYAFGLLLEYARRHGDGELADGEGTFLFRGSHASSFRHRLHEACARAGIPPLSPNDLRRTHGKWLRLVGVAPATIAPSMGHADARMVERVYGKSSPMELAGVQRAQILNPGGLLMGGATLNLGPQATPGPLGRAAIPAGIAVPRDGIEPPTRGFSIPSESSTNPTEVPTSPTWWDGNGQLASSARTGSREAEGDGALRRDPPATGRGVGTPISEDRPGPARARPPIVVDGRPVLEDEELSDVGAVFPFARGRR